MNIEQRCSTYQTRINCDMQTHNFLTDFCSLYGRVERKLFADYCKGTSIIKEKSRYLSEYGISARHFNSVRITLQGKIDSVLSRYDEYIKDTKHKIEQTNEAITELKESIEKLRKLGKLDKLDKLGKLDKLDKLDKLGKLGKSKVDLAAANESSGPDLTNKKKLSASDLKTKDESSQSKLKTKKKSSKSSSKTNHKKNKYARQQHNKKKNSKKNRRNRKKKYKNNRRSQASYGSNKKKKTTALELKDQKQKVFFKQRSLTNLENKLKKLELKKESNKAGICFGSKPLFKQQHNLEENNYRSHAEWKEAWGKARSSQLFLIGSKDETSGNQSCIATLNDDESIDLRIKVPSCLSDKYGEFVTIKNVKFSYGHETIIAAIHENIKRNNLSKKEQRILAPNQYKLFGQAINYRFLLDEKGFRVFVTTNKKVEEKISKLYAGSIGIDLNVNHLAVVEINSSGNFIKGYDVPINTYGKSKEQAKAIIGDAVKKIVDHAILRNKPIVIEKLDFSNKKRGLRENSKKYARMLSSFCYSLVKDMLKARAFRHGVKIYEVNPAYSSVIGRVKFAKIYKISVHKAAALVIARRVLGLSERLPYCWKNIPDNSGARIILPGLVKIQDKHVWSLWSKVLKNLKVVLAAQYQMHCNSDNQKVMTENIS